MHIKPDDPKLKDTKLVITSKKGATVRLGPDGPGNPDFPCHFGDIKNNGGNINFNLDSLRKSKAPNGIASPITVESYKDGSVVTIEGLLI